MTISKYFKTIWAVLDGFLMLSILVMMSAVIFASGMIDRGREYGRGPAIGARELSRSHRSYVGGSAVSVEPVAYNRERSAQIARSMIVSESVQLPVRAAMDMRETDKTYEVRFALPQGAGEEDVSLGLNGNILTMVLDTEERTLMKRIRIPCNYARNSAMSHFVSNQVLYVEIRNQ